MTTTEPSSPRLPDIAVVVITYNHEAFVAECMGSIFAQVYPGRVHVIVSDDCSTDRTQAVIAEMTMNVPSNMTVQPVLRTTNVGGAQNLADAWEAANETRSAYIALLEGDDYWTDFHKLECQVRYLESHPDTSISFGLARELIVGDQPPKKSKVVVVPPNDRPTFAKLLDANYIPTCTVVYRSGILPRFPNWLLGCAFCDWPLHLIHANVGELHYMPRVLGVHRQHQGSSWASHNMMSSTDKVRATENVQGLAMGNLETKVSFRHSYVASRRHLWRAGASNNRLQSWAHLSIALLLRPSHLITAIAMRLRRHRANIGLDRIQTIGFLEGP